MACMQRQPNTHSRSHGHGIHAAARFNDVDQGGESRKNVQLKCTSQRWNDVPERSHGSHRVPLSHRLWQRTCLASLSAHKQACLCRSGCQKKREEGINQNQQIMELHYVDDPLQKG